ncbi:MAG: hypothetical protein LBM25_04460 [Bacteroidales bacterium]|jgi:hypothetical protein|nr:hypothetical protein [Bacteroidales bacterium]
MKTRRIKRALFVSFVTIISLTLLRSYVTYVRIIPLYGYTPKAEKPILYKENLFNGEFQTSCEKYAKENLGFMPFFVRVHNQFVYSVLSESPNTQIVYGKDGYLYDGTYISTVAGMDFIGDSAINEKLYRLSKVKDTLEKLNKKVIVMFAPNKTRFSPENIPEQILKKLKGKKNNYDYMIKAIEKTSIPYIDFNKWIISMKDTSTYALIPKKGIHWSRYASALAMDSIIEYISKMENIALPKLVIDSLVHSKNPKFYDSDLGYLLNVLWAKEEKNLIYPFFHIDSTNADKKKIRPLVIGDSFFWDIFDMGLLDKVLYNGELWYYCREIHSGSIKEEKPKKDPLGTKDLHNEINKFDLFILFQTEHNLNNFGFGFIDLAYNMFFVDGVGHKQKKIVKKVDPQKKKERIEFYKKNIYADKKWLDDIKKKAEYKKITLEHAILQDAEYLFEQENQ